MAVQKNHLKKTLVALIPLLVLFVVMLFIAKGMIGKSIEENKYQFGTPESFEPKYQIKENDKEAYKKRLAAFWTYQDPDTAVLKVRDRFELKDNGIFWESLHYTLTLPDSTRRRMDVIRTGYCNPFAVSPLDTSVVVCEVTVIRHSFVFDTDTCFGKSEQFMTWRMKRDGNRLERDGKPFAWFDPVKLDTFFAKYEIDLVNDVHLLRCFKSTGVEDFVRSQLTAWNQRDTTDLRDTTAVRKLIDTYYAPLLLTQYTRAYRSASASADGGAILELSIAPSGAVDTVIVTKRKISNSLFLQAIVKDVRSWTFRPVHNPQAAVKISFEVGIKK